jgi:hypothetical protein
VPPNAQVTYVGGSPGLHGMNMPIGPSSLPLSPITIDLDPGELLTRVSGTSLLYAAPSQLVRGVASLTLSTNRKVYGPYGVPTTDKPFDVQGTVLALHGAVIKGDTSDILAAIGFWRATAGKQVPNIELSVICWAFWGFGRLTSMYAICNSTVHFLRQHLLW